MTSISAAKATRSARSGRTFASATPAAGAVLQALREGTASPASAIGVEEFFEVLGLSDWSGLGKGYDYKEQQ